ncbi:MAG: BBP7 family outer membrane beta-barrel protein [Gemmataceae bacterium]|nr:BBP7 family outer membrane beta-barrel protein [Gemmataceae bacterium]
MARRWKMAAGVVAWLGLGSALTAQQMQPPTPIGPSGMVPPFVLTAQPGGDPTVRPPVSNPGVPAPPAPIGPGIPVPTGPGAPDAGEPPGLDASSARYNAFTSNGEGTYLPFVSSVNLEYLILWYRGHRTPILVTTGDPADPIPGGIGQPGTRILHGTQTSPGASNAFRLTYCYWLVDPEVLSFDTSFMIMEQRRLIFGRTSDDDGVPVISRPYVDPISNLPNADPRALEAVLRGGAQDNFYTRLMGAEANFKWNASGAPAYTGPVMFVVAGARWLRLDEKYQNNDFAQDLPLGSGQSYTFRDTITTYNEFIGGQLGIVGRWRIDRLSLELSGKLAVGPNFQTYKAHGQTVTRDDSTGTIVDVANEGFYVQSTNAGIQRTTQVCFVPELNVNLGINLNENLKFTVGYGIFEMINVIRSSSQLSNQIEIQPPGIPTSFPRGTLRQTEFWAQWLSLGIEVSY